MDLYCLGRYDILTNENLAFVVLTCCDVIPKQHSGLLHQWRKLYLRKCLHARQLGLYIFNLVLRQKRIIRLN